MSDRHLELGLFAPTVGTMPPAGKPGAFLLSHVEQTGVRRPRGAVTAPIAHVAD
jgi:hypothetical protein